MPRRKQLTLSLSHPLDGDDLSDIDCDANENRADTIDFLSKLPLELSLRILVYLPPQTLCLASAVSRQWRRIVDLELNFFWWNLCMERFWEPTSRPASMTRADKKRGWRQVWVEVWAQESTKNTKKKPVSRISKFAPPSAETAGNHNHKHLRWSKWDNRLMTKDELRQYYKSVRSKPKGKKPVHVVREWEWE
ncbi:uncharacterized protein VTP21DRAFT_2714 [Calcarisporiella thermophila]|uniref:uncharacterized protein n=1 Tax=Calcarisporiella thermophila TaxID=911321 RepID=UPI00374494E4